MKKIAIISAMIEEVQPIINEYKPVKIDSINNQTIYKMVQEKIEIYIFTVGIGKVNAAITTALAIKEYQFDFIINIGTAGSINKNVMIGDFVCADKLAFFDVDATSFGYSFGQIPQQQLYEEINVDKFLAWLKPLNLPIHVGTVLTGDSFIDDSTIKNVKIEKFDHPLCCEMESMSIVYTAHRLNTPIVVLRTISDNAFIDSNIEFDQYLEQVSQQYLIIFEFLLTTAQDLSNE